MNHIPIFGDLEEPFFYVKFDIFSGQKKQTTIYRFLFYNFFSKTPQSDRNAKCIPSRV